jgi:membrane fusion protein (multidrug efflux system)
MRDMKGNPYVYTVNKDNRVERRDIQTGEAIGGEWVVDSGLSSEDKVIVEGLDKVRPGVLVAMSAPTPPTHQQPAASSSKRTIPSR